MPVASATAERSFSVLRCLKTYVRLTMKNDRLSSLGLMHIYSPRFWSGLVQSNGGVRICQDTKGRFWTIVINSCLSKSLKLCLILCYMKPWNCPRSHHFASRRK